MLSCRLRGMAVGVVKSVVVSGALSLLRISALCRRRCSSSSSQLFAGTAGDAVRGMRVSSITCADCPSCEQWPFFGGLGFRFYGTQKLTSPGPKKSLGQGKIRRGRAVATRGTSRSDSLAAVVKEDQEVEEEEEEEEEWKSRNQSKRDAKRARQWGIELASLAPAQLKQAVRWAGLSQEVYDAVMIVKNLGTQSRVRNGRRRQYTYIGGLLRDVDPNVMDPVLKATKDGDIESIILNSPVLPDPEDRVDKDSWAEEEEDEEDEANIVAEEWLHGLLNGVSSVEDEVYSIYDVDFDRQQLRKLVRSIRKSSVVDESSAVTDPTKVDAVDPRPTLSANETKSQGQLRQFLINVARQRAENQTYLS